MERRPKLLCSVNDAARPRSSPINKSGRTRQRCGAMPLIASAPENPVSNGRDRVCKHRPESYSRADSHYRSSTRRRPAPDRADTRRLEPSSRADSHYRFPNRRRPALDMGGTHRLAPCIQADSRYRSANHIHIVRLRLPRCPEPRQRSRIPQMRFLLAHACNAPSS
jgi:hypothetical protein